MGSFLWLPDRMAVVSWLKLYVHGLCASTQQRQGRFWALLMSRAPLLEARGISCGLHSSEGGSEQRMR